MGRRFRVTWTGLVTLANEVVFEVPLPVVALAEDQSQEGLQL